VSSAPPLRRVRSLIRSVLTISFNPFGTFFPSSVQAPFRPTFSCTYRCKFLIESQNWPSIIFFFSLPRVLVALPFDGNPPFGDNTPLTNTNWLFFPPHFTFVFFPQPVSFFRTRSLRHQRPTPQPRHPFTLQDAVAPGGPVSSRF